MHVRAESHLEVALSCPYATIPAALRCGWTKEIQRDMRVWKEQGKIEYKKDYFPDLFIT